MKPFHNIKNNDITTIQPLDISTMFNDSIYPENYIIDHNNDKEIQSFFQNLHTENLYSEIDSDESLEINIHPSNILQLSEQSYQLLNITTEFIIDIKMLFNSFKENFELIESNNDKLNLGGLKKKFDFKEIIANSQLPTLSFLSGVVIPLRSNKFIFVQISKISKIINNKEKFKLLSDEMKVIVLEWLLVFLALLKTPLTDSESSNLFLLNKKIFLLLKNKKFTERVQLAFKANHIIISEIFNQKILNLH